MPPGAIQMRYSMIRSVHSDLQVHECTGEVSAMLTECIASFAVCASNCDKLLQVPSQTFHVLVQSLNLAPETAHDRKHSQSNLGQGVASVGRHMQTHDICAVGSMNELATVRPHGQARKQSHVRTWGCLPQTQ